jgi:hypothetical protein
VSLQTDEEDHEGRAPLPHHYPRCPWAHLAWWKLVLEFFQSVLSERGRSGHLLRSTV